VTPMTTNLAVRVARRHHAAVVLRDTPPSNPRIAGGYISAVPVDAEESEELVDDEGEQVRSAGTYDCPRDRFRTDPRLATRPKAQASPLGPREAS
jgi:hypothetical protein